MPKFIVTDYWKGRVTFIYPCVLWVIIKTLESVLRGEHSPVPDVSTGLLIKIFWDEYVWHQNQSL